MRSKKLKAAALKFFAEKGYEGASMAEIAHHAGIEKSSVYTHFPSKEALFLAVWEDLLNDYEIFMTTEMAIARGLSIEEQLYHIYRCQVRYYMEDMVRTRLFLRFTVFPPQHLTQTIYQLGYSVDERVDQQMQGLLSEGVRQGVIKDGSIDDYFHVFVSMLFGSLVILVYHQVTESRYTDVLWHFFWDGIKAS